MFIVNGVFGASLHCINFGAATDPCCGCGTALATLAEHAIADTYGIEINPELAQEAQGKLTRVGLGSFFYARPGTGCYHTVFLNPPYLSLFDGDGPRQRMEKLFLNAAIPLLLVHGILIYVIPVHRLTANICQILSKHFTDIRVYRFLDGEYQKFKQIVLFGVKQEREPDSAAACAQTLMELARHPDRIPLLTQLETGTFFVPDTQATVDEFRGAAFNQYELAKQMQTSEHLTQLALPPKAQAGTHHPLLPLKTGQIGLIAGSGELNGLIPCEHPHVVKGKVVKRILQSTQDITGPSGDLLQTLIKQTMVNELRFFVLTPNGLVKLRGTEST